MPINYYLDINFRILTYEANPINALQIKTPTANFKQISHNALRRARSVKKISFYFRIRIYTWFKLDK